MEKNLATIVLSLGMLLSANAPTISKSNSLSSSYFSKLETISLPKENPKEEFAEFNLPGPNYLSEKEINSLIQNLYKNNWAPKIISPEKYQKMIFHESRYNSNSFNKKTNVSGLAQIKETTWEFLMENSDYYKERFNPEKNLEAGLRYISWTEKTLKKENPLWHNLNEEEKIQQIIAAYNWGIGNLKKNNWDFSKAPTETKKYYEKI